MFFNYLKIALRNIQRQKFYAFINITGLTIGFIASLLIVLYIVDEFSYDRFHNDAKLIYRVNLFGRMSGQEFNSCYSSAPVAASFVAEIPEVEQGCRIAPWKDISIVLKEDAVALDEVVIIGYGTQKKSDITGSISSLKVEDVTKIDVPNITQAIQGHAPTHRPAVSRLIATYPQVEALHMKHRRRVLGEQNLISRHAAPAV